MPSFLLFLLLAIQAPAIPPAVDVVNPANAANPANPANPGTDALAIASSLARLGPRPPGIPTHAAALALLRQAMIRAGLTEVTEIPVPGKEALKSLTGVLPGTTRDEIVISAHYDTVSRSPGAGDDGSGCATLLAAAADLARTPRQHTVRVFLADGEESGDLGSKAWLSALGPAGRDRILAWRWWDGPGAPGR
jgi:acetylornithine deacetylase/succinyl-diaminopimelate desuccinylase-like protein